jgi:hypothetical protein
VLEGRFFGAASLLLLGLEVAILCIYEHSVAVAGYERRNLLMLLFLLSSMGLCRMSAY